MQKNILCLLVLTLFLLGQFNVGTGIKTSELESVIPRTNPNSVDLMRRSNDAPIIINGNAAFAAKADSGSGTAEDPYIIADKVIDASGLSGIDIRNTNVYFILENNVVSGAGGWPSASYKLEKAVNGILRNNIASNNSDHGFHLYHSSNNTLVNNTANNNGEVGFVSHVSSNFNTFTNNTASNNGRGFAVSQSNDNTLTDNIARNNTDWGFFLTETCNNTLTNNLAKNNDLYGFSLSTNSDFNTLIGNTASNNYYGLWVHSCVNNTLINNTASNNADYGIDIGGDNNLIEFNTFIENNNGSTQGYDNGFANVFRYNYWNDHSGSDVNNDGFIDTPYFLDGSANNTDNYPFGITTPTTTTPTTTSFNGFFFLFGLFALAMSGLYPKRKK